MPPRITEMKSKASVRKGVRPRPPTLSRFVTSLFSAVLPRKTHVGRVAAIGSARRPEYFDRDQSSARAIAGLRCIKLSGLGRPSAFRCPRAKAQILTVVR
jgi:hypothetical protein